jgi:predicted GNAT family acetyltransferase
LVTYNADLINDEIELASVDDLDELVLMFQDYYIEEYNGERNKSEEYLTPTITSFIQNESLYVIKKEQVITTFCSILNPDIGIIFTKPDYRNLGLGRRLLGFCTKILYDVNDVVYLMTDKHNPASNKVCEKIGYDLIYLHTNLKL